MPDANHTPTLSPDERRELEGALAAIDGALKADEPAAHDISGPCEAYWKVKPWLERALPWIRKLPYGGTIAAAIELLMKLADKACPA